MIGGRKPRTVDNRHRGAAIADPADCAPGDVAYLVGMTVPAQTGYRLRVDPIPGRVQAMSAGQVVADTCNARVMYETRLPLVIYVPESDVSGLGRRTEHRTFCPFKGTAVYRDLNLPHRSIENAAWSYPRALSEAVPVDGHVAFMPGVIDSWKAEMGMPRQVTDGSINSPVVDWLMREAWQEAGPAELTRALALAFVSAGIAVSRLQITIWSLHPLIAGATYTWQKARDAVRVYEARHEMLRHPSMYNSPIRWVSEGLGGVRQPLTGGDAEFWFPIMDDLKRAGATDYVAMPLPFSTGRINVLTMASDHPDGFTTANLGLVFECSTVISRHFEVHSQRENSETLLGTFLGKRTGRRVLGGEIRRGDGEEIEAAVLFADLRGSSRLATEMDRAAYLELLNTFFETVSSAVEAEGGEVLKFIGDAVLAVFHAGHGHDRAGAAAMASAIAIRHALPRIEEPDGHPIEVAVGVSLGRVTYGNVGSRDRLDFTVIGEAANVAARLSDLCKTLGETVLAGAGVGEAFNLRSIGRHRLHNIADPVEVYALKD